MTQSLFDSRGNRKYLVARERQAFTSAASSQNLLIAGLCLTLATTGARISEVLAITTERVDPANRVIVIETLKRREVGLYRAIPVPDHLLKILVKLHTTPGQPLWSWGRTTAWKIVKSVMKQANIRDGLCQPKSLRHAFAVEAVLNGVPLNIVQRWLGHARIETTAIYASAIGKEERALARKTWRSISQSSFHV
jgi:integrase/recombinase XerD